MIFFKRDSVYFREYASVGGGEERREKERISGRLLR